MVILFFGDIVGKPGREAVKKVLPELSEKYRPDVVLANAENIAHGAGIHPEKIAEMLEAGIDGFTLGDHAFEGKDVEELLNDSTIPIVRPANWPGVVPGVGWKIIGSGEALRDGPPVMVRSPERAERAKGVSNPSGGPPQGDVKKLLLMNVLGRYGMKVEGTDMFAAVENMLEQAKGKFDVSFLDIHAAATSEKRAIAEVYDGRIDVIVGTHTHVQTNDAQTLKRGAGFISDVGMCGPQDSVLGVKTEYIIAMLKGGGLKGKRELGEGPCEVGVVVAKVSEQGTELETVRIRDIDSHVNGYSFIDER